MGCQPIVKDASLENGDSDDEASVSKNIFGVGLSKGKPIGIVGTGIFCFLTIYLGYSLVTQFNLGALILTFVVAIATGLSVMFSMSEKRWLELEGANRGYDSDYNERHNNSMSPTQTKSVCRECNSEIPTRADRCPHCGWKPEKKGGLWWGATTLLSPTIIGWGMAAKGASDKHKASKGVSKQVPVSEEEEIEETVSDSPEKDPTDTLERLNELKEQGIITEGEFEEKKTELLDQI